MATEMVVTAAWPAVDRQVGAHGVGTFHADRP